jgi:sugar-specific transcriptional regulator TrmB
MHDSPVDDAVELLQTLGLKEYEAKCFVALARIDAATARDVSDLSEVPRTRVYDAVDALEDAGLVARQHSNPQRFRAVPVAEAAETLRDEYDARIDDLRAALDDLPAVQQDDDDAAHEVWTLSGATAVENRTERLVSDARETLVVVATADALTEDLVDGLEAATARGVEVAVGGVDQPARDAALADLDDAGVFAADATWLASPVADAATLDRILLVDGESVLFGVTGDAPHAVVGAGADNALVALARSLFADAPVDGPVAPPR